MNYALPFLRFFGVIKMVLGVDLSSTGTKPNSNFQMIQFYDVQNCNSVQIVHFTYAAQKAKLLNYFATALKYQLYQNESRRRTHRPTTRFPGNNRR